MNAFRSRRASIRSRQPRTRSTGEIAPDAMSGATFAIVWSEVGALIAPPAP